ncbi:Holliday junction DNA helicase ruvA [Bifidobacterium actinocoloniiforme DSM 22766]|uniref:Holliday junction branch migration complex subunit RuvA n=1 Tax=Bifidobacterium actinocoloniiforme DSM 22766 TaxID=1437605 RepID=A0A086Z0H1_9BIFI|nr:Holliday junction branch migration protein RuvA [Bifidobacterium actinocoloniiforme]AKV55248.1 ATP-dependent DNA helicase RuvA [Bifidobacterium actinocoloniiforme DSM 22766]KFI40021.1 Holliday junction DNA helicase ruvA [Bifidobacterium actinocoloniiforme DSM 22766]
MLAMLTGSVAQIEQSLAVIDVGGVGYEVRMPSSDLAALRTGAQATVYTSLNISQDAVTLYGFLSRSSKTLFTQLLKVSGIGPRVAISLLSSLTPDQLAQAVSQGDAAALSRAPGLGKKGAQKIILELSGKMDVDALNTGKQAEAQDQGLRQVIEGLVSLGWVQRDAERAVEEACQVNGYEKPLDRADVPLVLKAALSLLDRGR